MANNIKLNVMNICRICLNESPNMTSLFTYLNDNDRTLAEMLTFVANIKVKMRNKFPKQVCNECKEKLYLADVFKRRCIKSETILDDILSTYEHELDKPAEIEIAEHLQANTAVNNMESLQNNEETQVEIKVENVNEDSDDYEDGPYHKMEMHETVTDNRKKYAVKYKPSLKSKRHLKCINKKKYMCHKCDRQFNSLNEWTSHRKEHSVVVGMNEIHYECSLCHYKFTRKSSLTNHIRHHKMKESNKVTCLTCDCEFMNQAHLDKHILSVHMNNDSYTCWYCSTDFTTKEGLEIHLKSHKMERKHQCMFCNKSFGKPSTLVDHMRTHTGEKPFHCSICGRAFSQKVNMRQHMMRHQKNF